MRLLKTLSLLACLLSWGVARADSVDPDLSRLVREAQKPRVHYGPARVGWNGPDMVAAARPMNPVYESLRLDSPAAIRAELKAVLLPDWQVFLAFAALIFGLRLLRSSPAPIVSEPAPPVLAFPPRALPRQQEAA